jgi:hypothetical protein
MIMRDNPGTSFISMADIFKSECDEKSRNGDEPIKADIEENIALEDGKTSTIGASRKRDASANKENCEEDNLLTDLKVTAIRTWEHRKKMPHDKNIIKPESVLKEKQAT